MSPFSVLSGAVCVKHAQALSVQFMLGCEVAGTAVLLLLLLLLLWLRSRLAAAEAAVLPKCV
jgi:hypothetical protein